MKITPEELEQKNYTVIDRMNHADLMPFVKKYLNSKSLASFIYYITLFSSFGSFVFAAMLNYKLGNIKGMEILDAIKNGILIFLALIPIHELIHGFAYKSVGAKNTSFSVNLKKFYFLAMADKFVASKGEFRYVALLPFLVITTALLALLPQVNPYWQVVLLSTLTLHSSCCAGDFALLSYFEAQKGKTIVTYDDKEEKMSYFLEKGLIDSLKN